jgi:hypothetical protein
VKLAPGALLALAALGVAGMLVATPLVMYTAALTLVPVVQAQAAEAAALRASSSNDVAIAAAAASSGINPPKGGQTPGFSAGPLKAQLPKPRHQRWASVQIPTYLPLFAKTPDGGFDVGGLPFGQCTWYVALQRGIVAHANGTDWVPNLAGRGFITSNRPSVGAIMSFRAFSPGYGVYGHVAVVVDVDSDGRGFTIAEANVLGLGLADVRWVPITDPGIEGFVP